MALPRLVSSSFTLSFGSNNPVHKSSGGNYYIIAVDRDSLSGPRDEVVCLKATSTVDATWSEVDSSNRPDSHPTASTWNVGYMASVTVSNVIHVAYVSQNGSGGLIEVKYARMDMGTDTWGGLESGANHQSVFASSSRHPQIDPWCDICHRGGTNPLIMAHQGQPDNVMGQTQERVSYAYRSGLGATTSDTWTADVALDGGGDVHYGQGLCVKATGSARTHFSWSKDTNTANHPPTSWNNCEARTLNGTSLATTQVNTADTASVLGGFTNFSNYDSSSTETPTSSGYDGSAIGQVRWTVDGSGDINGSNTADGYNPSPAVHVEGEHPAFSQFANGTTDPDLYHVWGDTSTNDLYYSKSTDDGQNWDSSTEAEDAVTVDVCSVTLLDTDTLVVVYGNFNADIYVTEIDISTGPTGHPWFYRMHGRQ